MPNYITQCCLYIRGTNKHLMWLQTIEKKLKKYTRRQISHELECLPPTQIRGSRTEDYSACRRHTCHPCSRIDDLFPVGRRRTRAETLPITARAGCSVAEPPLALFLSREAPPPPTLADQNAASPRPQPPPMPAE
jgi:hypothetical protein